MVYIYPKLSNRDFGLFRCGGAGLGNILFTYARAAVYVDKNPETKLIWPTWPSLKIGPFLRREKDKRLYFNLFRNNAHYVSGIKKMYLLMTKKRVNEQALFDGTNYSDSIVEITGFEDGFTPIINDSKFVYGDLIRNLAPRNRAAIDYKPKGICVHIRLGDFSRVKLEDALSGKHNSAIPIEWYLCMVNDIRKIVGDDVPVHIFSDGTDEELETILKLPNTKRITFGSAIADIIALSQSKLFIASGSSFSMWARYLGRMTTIMFPNQVKQEILFADESGKEIVAQKRIPKEYEEYIRTIFR